jgi:light-regulated signal transduction histidine kinase (bacteriophytochrome)
MASTDGKAISAPAGCFSSSTVNQKVDPSPAVLLKQVFINLLSNAFKFTRRREKPVIEIGCDAESGSNVYFVRDNGAGFDMKDASQLFGVFQRLHSERESSKAPASAYRSFSESLNGMAGASGPRRK